MPGNVAAECDGDVGEPDRGPLVAREEQTTATRTERPQGKAGVAAAVDPDLPTDELAEGVKERGTRESGRLGIAHETDVEGQLRRRRQHVPRLGEVLDDDRDLAQRGRSAARPGSSLPSSHSRNAPPAVET